VKAVVLTRREFEELGEYSCSLPTGTTVGKRWKRNANAFTAGPVVRLDFWDGTPVREKLPDVWWMGEYVEHEDPKLVGINWYQIVLEPDPVPEAVRAEIPPVA